MSWCVWRCLGQKFARWDLFAFTTCVLIPTTFFHIRSSGTAGIKREKCSAWMLSTTYCCVGVVFPSHPPAWMETLSSFTVNSLQQIPAHHCTVSRPFALPQTDPLPPSSSQLCLSTSQTSWLSGFSDGFTRVKSFDHEQCVAGPALGWTPWPSCTTCPSVQQHFTWLEVNWSYTVIYLGLSVLQWWQTPCGWSQEWEFITCAMRWFMVWSILCQTLCLCTECISVTTVLFNVNRYLNDRWS